MKTIKLKLFTASVILSLISVIAIVPLSASAQVPPATTGFPPSAAAKIVTKLDQIGVEIRTHNHSVAGMLQAYLVLRGTYNAISLGKTSSVSPFLVWRPALITDSMILKLLAENRTFGGRRAPDRILLPALAKMKSLLVFLPGSRI